MTPSQPLIAARATSDPLGGGPSPPETLRTDRSAVIGIAFAGALVIGCSIWLSIYFFQRRRRMRREREEMVEDKKRIARKSMMMRSEGAAECVLFHLYSKQYEFKMLAQCRESCTSPEGQRQDKGCRQSSDYGQRHHAREGADGASSDERSWRRRRANHSPPSAHHAPATFPSDRRNTSSAGCPATAPIRLSGAAARALEPAGEQLTHGFLRHEEQPTATQRDAIRVTRVVLLHHVDTAV